MPEEFVSEPLAPAGAGVDTARMALGEPGLPEAFRWRDHTVAVAALVRAWRETGPCTSGSGERYVRKHWFEIETAGEGTWKVYFERQSRGGRGAARWWLYSRTRGDAQTR